MPRGFDQPTSSSASRAANAGTREQSQQQSNIRIRQGRFEAPATIPGAGEAKQPFLTASRRKSINPIASPLPQSSREPQPFPAGRRSPAYLQGKNPYGQVLDNIEHPYREPKAETTIAVPSAQAGSSIGERSPASGPSDSKTRSRAYELKQSDPIIAPSLSRPPNVPQSVRSAKDFFETRASHYPSTPLPPPSTIGVTRKSFAPKSQPPSGACAPTITIGTAIPPVDMTDYKEQHDHDVEQESMGRRRSTNIFAGTPEDARPFAIDLQAASDSSVQECIPEEPLAGNVEQRLVEKSDSSDEVVRRLSTRSSVPAAETREAKNPDLQSQQEGRRAKSGRNLRRTFEEDQGTSPKRLRRSGSYTASLAEISDSSKEPIDRVAEWTLSTDTEISSQQFGKSVNVRRRAEEIVSSNLGHDGASDVSSSRRSTMSGPIPTANIGVEEKYHEIEVPDDVDNRQGYGRRVTQDFGFPGARIKSHGTNRISKPLRDPGSWTKRACGHFSYMGKGEHRDHAQQKICRQCSTRAPPPEQVPATQRRERRRALSESSTSTTSSSKPLEDDICRKQRRRRHHSECIPYDKCGDAFVDELGYIIDNILEEHANTLQSVISNIKNKKLNVGSTGQLKPNLNDPCFSLREALQSIPDLVDLVNSAADDLGIDLERRPTVTDDDLFRNAPYESTPRESVSYHPGVSLEATEDKTADEEPPTEDSWLQQTRRHLTELSEAREQLMDELDSIAGDLDVRLQDRQESGQGEELIVHPVQRVLSRASVGASPESTWHENPPADSNTAHDYYDDESYVETAQRMLERVPTRLSNAPTWQRKRSTGATIENFEVGRPNDHDEEAVANLKQLVLSREPTGVSSKVRRSESKPVDFVSGDVLSTEVLRGARDELPAAVASITAVLRTLPGTDYEPADEVRDGTALNEPAESIDEAQYSPQYETSEDSQLDQQPDETAPDTYNDGRSLTPSPSGFSVPIRDPYDQAHEPENYSSRESDAGTLTMHQVDTPFMLMERAAVIESPETASPIRRTTTKRFELETEHQRDALPQRDPYTEDESDTRASVVGRSAVSERTDSTPLSRRVTVKDLAAESEQGIDDGEPVFKQSTIPLSRQPMVRLEYESKTSATPTVIQDTRRLSSRVTSDRLPSPEIEESQKTQRFASQHRYPPVQPMPKLAEQATKTIFFVSSEPSPTEDLASQLRRRLSEIETAMPLSDSASRPMSPESSLAPRIATGLSPTDLFKIPSIETVNRISTKKATLMRSRHPTFREPARESTPPAQRSSDEDTLTTLPQMQVEELVLSPVTSTSNGSEQVHFLSLDEPTATSLRRLTTREPDRAAITLESAPHEESLLVVGDQEPGFLPPVQRIRRMITVPAEPTNVFSRRESAKEFKCSDTVSPVQQVRQSTTLVPSQQRRACTQSPLNEGKDDPLPSPPIQQTRHQTTAAPLFEQRSTSAQPTLMPEQDQSDFLPPIQHIRRSTTVSTKPGTSRESSPVVQDQDDLDFLLPMERIRRVTTVLPAAKRRASTVAERAISPELLLSLEERGSGFCRTLTSLDTRQGTGALLSGFSSQESLQILVDDNDDENELEFLYPVERIRRATTEVPHEQTQGTEELEHDATLSDSEDSEQLLPGGREESGSQPLAERIRRTTSLLPAYQNELLPFQQTHRNTTVSLAEEGEPAFSPSVERRRRATTGLAAEQQQATVATEQDVVLPESVSSQQSLFGQEEDSKFTPPVQRIRRTTTVATAERQQSTLQRRHTDFLPEPEITSESSPSDEDEPESRLQPVRRTTTAPLGVQQPMIEPELDSSAEVDSWPPVGQIRRSTTVQPAIQRQVTVDSGADALLVELGFNGAFPVVDEVTELEPVLESIRRSTVSPVQQMAGAYPGTPTSKSGSQEVTPVIEEEFEFQLPAERARQATDIQSVGRRQESRIASPVIEESGLEVSIERIRRTTTVPPAFQLQDSFRSTSESSTSSPVEGDRSGEAEFQFPVERVRRTTTLQPGEQLQESRTGSLVPKDGFEFQMPVERIRRTTTVESSGKRQDSFKPASVSSGTSPVAEEVLEQSVSSRAASRQPTFQARRTSTMPLATGPQHLATSISSPVLEDLAEGHSVSRVVSRQPTQASRTSTLLSAVPRNDSVELDRFPSLSLPEEGEPYETFSRQPTRRTTVRETEAKALPSSETPLEIGDVPDQIALSRSASHQPTPRENVLAAPETQQDPPGEAEGILAEPQVDARHLDHPLRRQKTDIADATLKERLTSGGRTTTTRVLSRTESLAYQSPEYNKEVPLDNSTELESRDVLESTHGVDRKEETDQVEKARTTDLASDTESFEPPIYQRIAEEPSDEGNDSRTQSKAGSPEVHGSEDLIGQSERAPTTHFYPTLAPVAHTDAEYQLDPDVQFERRMTQASQEIQPSIPRILTIPNGSNRKRSSDAGNIVSSATGFGPVVSTEVKSQRNESPQVARRKTQVPNESGTADRRRSSAAPGITAAPPEMISEQMKVGMQFRSPKQKPKKGTNYSPEQQYPPAPAYPLRETPSWTKPDTRTPPPKPKVESPPKKRGWLGLGPWPKEELLESEGERKKGKTVIQASPESLSIVENQMPSLCEGSTLDQGKPPSTLTRTTTTQSLQSFQTALTTIHGHSTHRLEGPATSSVGQFQRMKPSVRTNRSGSLPVGFRRDSLNVNRGLSKLFVHGRMFLPAPKHLSSRLGRILKSKSLARLKDRTKKRSKAQSVETSADQPKLEPQSQKKKHRLEKVFIRRERDGICLRFPRKKVRQMKESRVDRQAGCWKCLMLKRRKSKRKSQQDNRRLKKRSTIALESKRRWSWTLGSRKAKKTTPPAVASIDCVSSPSMTTPGLPAQLTSRVQEHHQNRPPEMKATKEGLQHQMQEKRRPLRENTFVNQPQHKREKLRPSSLQRRIQRSSHEGLHHQPRERKHDAGLQQLGKIERQSLREHPQSPEHQRERQQSHRVPDKQIVEDNAPPRERVHRSRVRPYSTTKRNKSKQEELNHHNSKKNEIQPRQPRHKQIEGHLLRPERVWQYSEQLYQDQRQQEKEGTDLLRQRLKDPSVQSRQFQHPTQGPVNPGHSQRKFHWQRFSQPTEAQSSKPSQVREQISSDPYTMPASGPRKAAALASSNANASANAPLVTQQVDPKSSPLTRRDSLKPRRSPTSRISELFGRDKTGSGTGNQQQRQQQAPTPAEKPLGAVTSGFGLTSSPAGKGAGPDTPAKSSQVPQPQAKVQAKAAQGGGITNPLRGRWGWGWGK
ncbi:hypothetical protein AA0111_g7015 [Alternaria arborescens]|uniref:hypothetical protein n=1 Tax=Alternaria arborescens TaxID=156630 RepID=UPI0010751A6D|nr:hypothetical protein AA0111_g7015 [Alternaria arborescens]RYO28084.1 hypothetical protein AA0111_g7015 [Alternaria arborescens]